MTSITREQVSDIIAELRSGKYRQTTTVMYSSETGAFCALGVAAMSLHLVNTPDELRSTDGTFEEVYNTINRLFQPVVNNLNVPDHMHFSKMVYLRNDTLGQSFEEIADWLEREILPAVPSTLESVSS